MFKPKKWILLQPDQTAVKRVSEKFNIHPVIASLILNRGFYEDDAIKSYIEKDFSDFCDPFLLPGIEQAVAVIRNAVESGKKIAVYGDYDVDGITSTYIVYDYLKSLGANVIYYIPDRAEEGYGMNCGAIQTLSNQGVSLIITVDVGITATEEVKFAGECGMEVIITDHHTPKEEIPKAVAVIDPKLQPNNYPNPNLAGCGVAFKLIYALSGCSRSVADQYCEAAAIGTIADMVELTGENRLIAHYGLEHLKTSKSLGLNALLKNAGISKDSLSSSSISFGIAPRLNAAGRIASARLSVQLFLEEDAQKAAEIAERLNEGNKFRQEQEREIMQQAEEIIERDQLYKDDVIIVAKQNWHHGIIGIVSSKITEKYYKPSAVISINNDGTCKASGRSIEGFNLFEALQFSADTLLQFGGHELAAGFSVSEENIDSFRKKINKYAKKVLTKEILTQKLVIDSQIDVKDISLKFAQELRILEPYGIGNRYPTFCVTDASLRSNRTHISGKHAFLYIEKNNYSVNTPAFNLAEEAEKYAIGESISIAGSININTYRGVDSPQFLIKDIHAGERSSFSADNLRCIFIQLRNLLLNSVNTININQLSVHLDKHCKICFGKERLIKAINIFTELQLLTGFCKNDTVYIDKGTNFTEKCILENSPTYRAENSIE